MNPYLVAGKEYVASSSFIEEGCILNSQHFEGAVWDVLDVHALDYKGDFDGATGQVLNDYVLLALVVLFQDGFDLARDVLDAKMIGVVNKLRIEVLNNLIGLVTFFLLFFLFGIGRLLGKSELLLRHGIALG